MSAFFVRKIRLTILYSPTPAKKIPIKNFSLSKKNHLYLSHVFKKNILIKKLLIYR